MGDRGLPASWRDMHGYGSHTYQWINAAGERFWVKYHFKTNQGVKSMTGDEAEALAGADADYYQPRPARGDRAPATSRPGTCTSRSCRTRTPRRYRFNPFDLTKVWPHADYPLIKVGTHGAEPQPGELSSREIEQAAFAPANFVPGHRPRPRTRCCRARLFSYARRPPLPRRHQPRPAPGERAEAPGQQLLPGRRRALPLQRRRPFRCTRRTPSAARPPLSRQRRAGGWENDGELMRSAHSLHAEDSDFGQAGTLYREVYNDGEQGALPGDRHRRRQRRQERRASGTRHPVLDQRRRRARRQAARQPRRRADRVRRRGGQQDRLTASGL